MSNLKKIMIKKAKNRYKKILPCGKKANFEDCFTVEKNKLLFWFNTEDQSTHVESTEL
jgi:hypothetical protein